MKDDRVYLAQILDSTEKIREFVDGVDNAAFLKDRKTQSAVIMQLALIGELAKKNLSANQVLNRGPLERNRRFPRSRHPRLLSDRSPGCMGYDCA